MPALTIEIRGMIKSCSRYQSNSDLRSRFNSLRPTPNLSPGRITMQMDRAPLLADEPVKALQGKSVPCAFSDIKPYLQDIKGINIAVPSISGSLSRALSFGVWALGFGALALGEVHSIAGVERSRSPTRGP